MQGPGVNGFFNKLCVVFDLSWRNEERHVKAASAETGESSNSLAVDAATAKAFCSGSARHCFAPDCSIVAGCNRGRALAVDVARAYSLKSDLQAAADAAAMAAAIMLPDVDEARQAANRAVRMNLPAYPGILRDDDLEFGQWQGSMKGHLIVQDGGSKKDNKWDSKAKSRLTGVVYLPDGKFTSKIEADITGTDACFVLIANEIKIDCKAKMSIVLSGTACRQSLPSAFSRSIALFE